MKLYKFLIKLLPKRLKVKWARRVSQGFLEVDPDRFVSLLLEKMEPTFDVNKSRKYDSAEEEVDAELEQLPELKPYRVYFVNTCRNLRIKYGLKE